MNVTRTGGNRVSEIPAGTGVASPFISGSSRSRLLVSDHRRDRLINLTSAPTFAGNRFLSELQPHPNTAGGNTPQDLKIDKGGDSPARYADRPAKSTSCDICVIRRTRSFQ